MKLLLTTLALIALVGCGSKVSDGPADAKALSPEDIDSLDDLQSLAEELGGFIMPRHLILSESTITDAGLVFCQSRNEESDYYKHDAQASERGSTCLRFVLVSPSNHG